MSTVLVRLAVAAAPRRAAARSVDDPLGPTGQQPDGPRDLACDLTASESVCSPSTIAPLPDRPDLGSPSGASFGSGFGTVLVWLLVIALVVALVWMVILAIRNRGTAVVDIDDLDEDLDDVVDERIIDQANPPDRWRDEATKHRAAGRYRDAVRCEYRALVGDLARAGVVDEIPGRTSGEERVQLAELAPDVAPTFSEAADLFDEAWFDDDEVTAVHDARFRAAEDVVVANVLGNGRDARVRLPVRGRR